MYTNAQSLISKIDELAATASEKKPDFILLTETWCNNTIDNALLTIPGYGIEIRKDRTDTAQGIGGGLIVYARQGWRLEEEEDTNDFNQHCKFRVKCGGVDIRFILIYRSPNSPPEATDKLIEIMEKAEKNTFMVGDFNYPKIDWQRGTATGRKPQEFMTATEENMMTQLVEFATHTKGNTLDLVITNSPELVDSLEEEGRLGRSDHVIMEMEIGVENRSEEEDGKEYNDWKKADWNQIRRDIGREDWRRTMEGKTVNEAWELLKKKLEETTEKNVPKRRRRNRNRPPWLTQEILRGIRKKKRMWKKVRNGEGREEYREEEKIVGKMIRNAKRSLEKRLAKEKNNKRPFYAYVKGKTKSRQTVGQLRRKDGTTTENDKEAAEELNIFFGSVYSKKDSIQPPPDRRREEAEMKMRKVRITDRKIKEKIEKMRAEAAPGPDGIRPAFLQQTKDEIVEPLRRIFEKSLEEGKIPEDWRKANITPIYKKGKKSEAGNYRPVALTSVCCKLLEHIIRDEVVEHLEKNGLLTESQHGFREKRSCATNLLEFFEKTTEITDNGGPVDIVFLDLAKAFDKVPHNLLVQKMRGKQVSEEVVVWTENWLKNREQRVLVNGEESEWAPVDSGIIQGSVLGPTYFTIYIDDIDEILKELSVFKKFADDTKLGQEMRTLEDKEKLQKALDGLVEWSTTWGMEFNVAKCKVMHVGQRNPGHVYNMAGKDLEETEEEKDIGVTVTKDQRPSQQCRRAARTARGVLSQIQRAFHYRDKKTFKNLYVQYVRPHVEFAAPAWAPWTAEDRQVLERVQQQAVKMMSGLRGQSYEEKCKEIGLDTLENRREDADMIQTFKIITRTDKVDRSTWFKMAAENAERVTRAASDKSRIAVKRVKTEARRHFYSQRVVEKWNKLPMAARDSKNVKSFKRALKTLRERADL